MYCDSSDSLARCDEISLDSRRVTSYFTLGLDGHTVCGLSVHEQAASSETPFFGAFEMMILRTKERQSLLSYALIGVHQTNLEGLTNQIRIFALTATSEASEAWGIAFFERTLKGIARVLSLGVKHELG